MEQKIFNCFYAYFFPTKHASLFFIVHLQKKHFNTLMMSTSTIKKNDFNQSIINDLKSDNKTKIKNAFKKITNKGKPSIIQPLIDLYCEHDTDTNLRLQKLFLYS